MSSWTVENSAQTCGCDAGEKHLCERHAALAEAQQQVIDTAPGEWVPVTVGIGGAPTRCTTLPKKASERKKYPVASGFMDYFPDAIAAISNLSWIGNEQHNSGQALHWARGKSADEADTMMRHFLERGTLDTDGIRHSAKMAWRALALLQKEIESELRYPESMYGPDPRD